MPKARQKAYEALDPEWSSPLPWMAKDEFHTHEHGAGADCGDRVHAPRVTGLFTPISGCLDTSGRDQSNEGGEYLSLSF